MLSSFLEIALEWVVPVCEFIAIIVILISVGIAFFYLHTKPVYTG